MIITVSREFGSGGREIGKRLADEFGLKYFDREIIQEVASRGGFSEEYVERSSENGVVGYPITYGKSFSAITIGSPHTALLIKQQEIIREIAEKGDAVIVGRAANFILRDVRTFDIFVYSTLNARIERCACRAALDGKTVTEKEILKQIKKLDENRRRLADMICGLEWGRKEYYDLMLNSSTTPIKNIIKPVADYIRLWFSAQSE